MKFKIEITKEVIDKSLMCGTLDHVGHITTGCAFAVAYNQLIPSVRITEKVAVFGDGKNKNKVFQKPIAKHALSEDQQIFIKRFDYMAGNPINRYILVGQNFDVEIPDEVIEYWYGDASKAAQKIIDNPIISVLA